MLQMMQKRTVSMLNAGGLCLLVTGVAAMNDDVRNHLSNAVFGDRVTEFSIIAAPARDAMRAATSMVGHYSSAPGSVLAFGIGAVVLFCLMFRI
jgi:hypothetical protein